MRIFIYHPEIEIKKYRPRVDVTVSTYACQWISKFRPSPGKRKLKTIEVRFSARINNSNGRRRRDTRNILAKETITRIIPVHYSVDQKNYESIDMPRPKST